MRLLDRIERFFMDPYQRELTDPAQYTKPVDAKAVLDELVSGRSGFRDHETIDFMRGALESELENKQKLTIEGVADQARSMGFALREPHPECLHEFGVTAKLGAELLADYLVKRANLLAAGIKPGSTEALARAFDL